MSVLTSMPTIPDWQKAELVFMPQPSGVHFTEDTGRPLSDYDAVSQELLRTSKPINPRLLKLIPTIRDKNPNGPG